MVTELFWGIFKRTYAKRENVWIFDFDYLQLIELHDGFAKLK